MVRYSNECKGVSRIEKKHLLRSVNKDRARSDVIEKLSDGDVPIERDWAMKHLPMMYNQS